MKILLTGHKGFIGSNLLEKLRSLDHQIITIDKKFLDNIFWRVLLDEHLKQVDLIFHVGAISDTTLQDSTKMFKYNYLFSKELFDLAQKQSKKVIYSSSASCFGDGDGVPNNTYGWSKLLAEDYGMVRCDRFVSLRYFNVYGRGEGHKGGMASVAHRAYSEGGFKLFPVKAKRDFIYIDDVVDANICAMSSPKGIYEVGTGEANTFESLLDGMGVKYTYYHTKNEVPFWYQYYTCANKTKRVLGWEPKFNIKSGTKKYKKYLNEILGDRR